MLPWMARILVIQYQYRATQTPPPSSSSSSIKPSDSSTELDVFCACGAISNVGYYNGGWDEMMMTATSACIQSKKGSGQEAMSDGV